MKVTWAVSEGEYSDYGVEATFATKELAEAYASRMGDRYRVEEFPYYEELPPMHVVWTARQSIWNDNSAYNAPATPSLNTRSHVQVGGESPEFAVNERPDWGNGRYSGHVQATGPDRERCVKSVADRVARIRAERAGLA